jgi:acyl carrier protein
MKIPVSKLEIHKPLEDQGFDSLMAIEVKYAVESELEVEVPVRNLIEKPTVALLATELSDLLPG